MSTQVVPLIKGDRVSTATDFRDALPVNMYAVPRNILGADGYMLCWPGLKSFATGFGADRGAVYNERFTSHYRVSGEKFVHVNSGGVVTELGDVPGNKQISMPYSFNTQGVISDGRFWLYAPSSGFNEVTSPSLGSPIDGVWVDGYYFLTDGEFIFHTDINDETSIDPLKFATAEFMPDPSLGLGKTPDNKVIVFGRYSIEYFVNVATANFAFQRIETRAQKIGIVGTHAKCELGGQWYITGGRKEESLGIHVIGVGSSMKVSTREVDKILDLYNETDLANMRMECRSEDGITFVLVHLPNETLCFNVDIAQQFGKERSWSILKTGFGDANYRAINGVFEPGIGQWVFGDKYTADIALLDDTIFSQYGEVQEWYLYTPFLQMETGSIDEIDIETIPGFTSADDATVAISITSDGINYSQEWWEMYGQPQAYNKRFIIRRLGYVSDWVGFRFRGLTQSRMAFAALKITYG